MRTTEERLEHIEGANLEQTERLNRIEENTKELLQAFAAVKGTVRVAALLAHFVKWCLIIAGGFAAVKFGLRDWILPK